MAKEKDIEREEALAAFNDMLNSSLRAFTEKETEVMLKAFSLAYEAHKGTRRKSGEPYITHPIAVAKIVAHEIGLGYKSITAALLHDVVEDTDYTCEDIQGIFGEKISFLVNGLTKFDNIFDTNVSIQAENFRKMMLAMADDIRVVLIKLADRLHNMRTLGSMAPHKQEKIASETIYVYAPLAHRLGLYNIKTELEDLTMKFQFPKLYTDIQSKIAASAPERNTYVEQFIAPIKERLKDNNVEFEISGRVKSIYSIWKKMETKQIPFEEIYDLFAVRIVFKPSPDSDEKQQCWQIYSMVTDIYRPNYNRLRDWLTTPKENGYEALHITVMGAEGKWVELQIRTERMNRIAERGYAAHWNYKENKDTSASENTDSFDIAMDSWLGRIREMLKNSEENATEFLDQFKLNAFADNITVYSPKGKMVQLPNHSTVIDFAYEIHSAIGNHSIGAKVNHKLVPLNYELSSGDQVEMLTADNQKPQAEWLNFAAASRTRNHIKAALKAEVKEHFQKGKQAVEDALRSAGAQPNAKLYKRITDAYNVSNKQELFSQVGAGILSLDNIERIVRKPQRNKFLRYMGLQLLPSKRKRVGDVAINDESVERAEPIDKKAFLLKEGTDPSKLAYRIAECCKPIPGDSVVGFLLSNNKVLIHKKDCPIAIREASQHGDKIVNAKWTEHKVLSYLARVRTSGIDRVGMLSEMLKVISEEMRVNIRRLNAESHNGLFEDEFDIYVHSTTELNNIISKLQRVSGVEEVKRIANVD